MGTSWNTLFTNIYYIITRHLENALEIILEHLDKILEKTKLNESQLQEFKYDQRQILKEINKIKNYLDKCK